MEIDEQKLYFALNGTLSPDSKTRKDAESFLSSCVTCPGYLVRLLSLINQLMMGSNNPADISICQSGSVLFKNVIKTKWVVEDEDSPISVSDKTIIKNEVVKLMALAPVNIQKQLAEAVTIISKYDFPNHWQNLLPELVEKLKSGELSVVKGVMLTANSIMKRFRYVFKSDELFTEILYCLQLFAGPLLEQYQRCGQLVDSVAGSKESLVSLFETLRLMTRVFYSLNWQDIPEVFEDHVKEWMQEFAKYLTYKNPLLVDSSEENEAGPIEALQAAILENLNIYTSKYEEVFEPFLPQFTEIVWKLLLEVGDQPKYDQLATGAIKFLSTVCSKQANIPLFTDAVLMDIIKFIVVKNITATEADEELFEDNPTDYVRKDMEGSDQDTRRRCAIELVRSLMKHFSGKVTNLCLQLANELYVSNDWKAKDVALHLILSVSVQNTNALTGASELNSAVDIMSILQSHIFPEIFDPVVKCNPPIVKADAIKFICVFRSHFDVPSLVKLFPCLIQFLLSEHAVLHTYAAICIDKILSLKADVNGVQRNRISKNEISPFANPLFEALFSILQKSEVENEYVMKCIMKSLMIMDDFIAAYYELIVPALIGVLQKVAKNPVNPYYNHYLFESLALIVRGVCGDGTNPPTETQATNYVKLETFLFPIFQLILQQDVAELIPYVFQIFAQLLCARPERSGLSEPFSALFVPLLNPSIWEKKGNIPALVELFKAYISRGIQQIVGGNKLTGVLGIFQKLLSQRSTEVHAFALLNTIYAFCEYSALESFVGHIFKLLLEKMQMTVKASKTHVYVKQFLHNICVFAIAYGPSKLYDILESMTKGLTANIILSIWSQNKENCASNKDDVNHLLIGGTKLLVETPVCQSPEVWVSLLKSILPLLTEGKKLPDLELKVEDEAEGKEFDTTYSKLSHTKISYKDLTSGQIGQNVFAVELSQLTHRSPGMYSNVIVSGCDETEKTVLQNVLHQNGVVLK